VDGEALAAGCSAPGKQDSLVLAEATLEQLKDNPVVLEAVPVVYAVGIAARVELDVDVRDALGKVRLS
jgi:hypothetical protein